MTLTPYPDLNLRRVKVLKHVFSTEERWWEALDGLTAWKDDWDTLRVVGCFNAPPEEATAVAARHAEADAVLTRRHEDWLHAASLAVAEARATGGERVHRAPDGRERLIGALGVVVVVAGGSRLVTCWREPDGVTAAVRRAQRRASLNQPPQIRR